MSEMSSKTLTVFEYTEVIPDVTSTSTREKRENVEEFTWGDVRRYES